MIEQEVYRSFSSATLVQLLKKIAWYKGVSGIWKCVVLRDFYYGVATGRILFLRESDLHEVNID